MTGLLWQSLTDISGLARWDTSNVKGMAGMFYGCSSLKDVSPLSAWVFTRGVPSGTGSMFDGTQVTTYPKWYVYW